MARIWNRGLIGLQDINVGSGTFTRTTSTGGTQTLGQVPIVSANQYSGADIFAQANAAATALAGPGVVIIPSGTYTGVSTTLKCVSKVCFSGYGAVVTYSGTGTAISCQNQQKAAIQGLKLVGPGTTGSTVGLLVGIGSGGTGANTAYNNFDDLYISEFNIGIKIDGYASGNGTFSNTFKNVIADTNNIGWNLVPTAANEANENHFLSVQAVNQVSDGFKIDGSNGNDFVGAHSETNGGYGFNLPGTQITQGNTWIGGWGESNTSGDFNSGTAANIYYNTILGITLNSTTTLAGTWDGGGTGNTIIPSQVANANGAQLKLVSAVSQGTSGNGPFVVADGEGGSPTDILAVLREGVDSGHVYLGSTQYPVTARGNVVIGSGSAITSSGAGGTLASRISSGTATMTTAAIASLAAGTTVTVAATGVLSTDTIEWAYNADPSTNPGNLIINAWPTAGNVNFHYNNPTAGSITPSAATLNWRVVR